MSTLSSFLIDTAQLKPNPTVDKAVRDMVTSAVKAGPQINPDDNRRIRLNQFAIPHVDTFAAKYSSGTGSYYWYYDEALRNSVYNALAMRRTDVIQDPLEHRKMATASKDWFLKPDDPDDADQQKVCDQLESVIEKTYMFKDFILGLLEDIWFGKAAVQSCFNYEMVKGKKRLCVVDHAPIMGDKIQYHFYNKTPGILIYGGSSMFSLPEYADKIERTTLGPALYLTEPWLRDCFTITQFRKSDFDYIFEGEKALAVQGIGMRDTTYWAWQLRTEVLSWITDALQRVGANGMTYGIYEYGNAESEKEMIQFIKTLVKDSYAVVGVTAGVDPQNLIKNIPVSAVGYDVMLRILEYLDDSIRRIFLGQELTSMARSTGLGAATANIQKSSFDHIIKYDSDRLAETITRQLVTVLLKYNTWIYKGQEIPGDQLPFSVYFKFEDRDSEDDAPADTAKTLHEMGVPLDMEDVRDKTDFVAPRDKKSILPGKPPEQPKVPAPAGGLAAQGKGESSVPPNGRKQFAGFGNHATNGKGSPSLNQVELFNGPPDEKRDESGKWTTGGASHVSSPSSSPSQNKTENSSSSTESSRQTHAEISIIGESSTLYDNMKPVFGKMIPGRSLASLCGAPDNSKVELKAVEWFDSPAIKMTWENDEASAARYVMNDKKGNVIMYNSSFVVNEGHRGNGIGAKAFDQQIQHAQELGVNRMDTEAIRDDPEGWTGYRVWPMFGYDGDIPDQLLGSTPNDETQISQLMASKEGRDWWTKNGRTVELKFDLTPGSYSMKTWEAYKARKKSQ